MTQIKSESQAIQLAVEGGWKQPEPCELDGILFYHKGDTFMDPAFWIALGKKRGWSSFYDEEGTQRVFGLSGWYPTHYGKWTKSGEDEMEWLAHALQYFEVVLSNGSREEYWRSLP